MLLLVVAVVPTAHIIRVDMTTVVKIINAMVTTTMLPVDTVMITVVTVMTIVDIMMTTVATGMTTVATVMILVAIATLEAIGMIFEDTVMTLVDIMMIIVAIAEINTEVTRDVVHSKVAVAVVVVVVVSPPHIKMVCYVRFARRKAILQMSAGGDTQIIMVMTTQMSQELHMGWTQTGTWILALPITSPGS
jgi:hypothetical protein